MRVVLSRRANLDLLSHVGWLAQMSPKAAQEAAQTIREQLFTLATFPLAGRVLANDEHKWTIPFLLADVGLLSSGGMAGLAKRQKREDPVAAPTQAAA